MKKALFALLFVPFFVEASDETKNNVYKCAKDIDKYTSIKKEICLVILNQKKQ